MLEVGKKYVTRGKKLPARVLCTNLQRRPDCVAVAILDRNGAESIFTYFTNGKFPISTGTNDFDLIDAQAPEFDPAKPVQTRDGRKARIICTDRRWEDERPILALLSRPNIEEEDLFLYPPNGRFSMDNRDHPNDLINI